MSMDTQRSMASSSQQTSTDAKRLISRVRERATLQHVLKSGPIRDLATGEHGKFTTHDRALISSTVSEMQDKVIEVLETELHIVHRHMHEANNRTVAAAQGVASAVVAGMRQGWRMPLKPERDSGKKGVWAFFNVANLVKGGALVLVALAFYLTNVTASYKEQAAVFGTRLEEERKKVGEQEQVIAGLRTQLAQYNSTIMNVNAGGDAVKGIQKLLDNEQKRAQHLQDQLNLLNGELTDWKVKYARLEARKAPVSSELTRND